MRSLTPNFRKKKTFFVLWGPNHPHPEKVGFVDVRTPFPRQGGPPEMQCQLKSGLLNRRDRATAGFGRDRSHGPPREAKHFLYSRGFRQGLLF